MSASPENPKRLALDELPAERERLRASGCRLVLTNGVFDLLHTGHLHFLQTAARQGDALWVALNSDASVRTLKGPQRPVLSEDERAFAMAALGCVHRVFVFAGPRLDAEIRLVRPDVYAKAGDYTLETLDPGERAALEEVGASIRFLPFLKGYSTTELIEAIVRAYPESQDKDSPCAS